MLPDDILQQLKDHDRRLKDLERSARGTSIQVSNVASTSFNLAPGQMTLAWFTLQSATHDIPVETMGIPRWDLYRNMTLTPNAFVDSNLWPLGSGWTSAELRDLEITPQFRKYHAGTNATDLVFALFFKNRGTTAINSLGLYLEWKLPLLSGVST